jgi:polyvinyl alcohol dehydrogenase (cytochrome)
MRDRATQMLIVMMVASSLAAGADAVTPGPADWPAYGHDPHRTFSAPTTLDQTSVTTLAQAWSFATGDAVTANPIEVGGVVYVGSWDGNFYAIDAVTGQLRWRYAVIFDQQQIHPQPPFPSTDTNRLTADGGIITSSAYFLPGEGTRPDLVIFGAGYRLYALVATGPNAGTLFWEHLYSGRPELAPDPANDPTRIFSSPAVVGNHVLFSVSADGASGFRGYLASADVLTGTPQWIRELDVNAGGHILNDGCGNVWGSPTIIESLGVEIVGVADCHATNQPPTNMSPYTEHVLAVNISDGTIFWNFDPGRADPGCDFDFGATANLGANAAGTPTFLGIGGKDGTYYSLDPATGTLRWKTNVVFGGSSGGFLGSTAYDGSRAYGATALGDLNPGGSGCQPSNPQDLPTQEPSMHAFDIMTGTVGWQQQQSQSFGATTVAGGMTFVGSGVRTEIQIRDAASGNLLKSLSLPASSNSGTTVVGNAVIFGTGTNQQASPAGVYAYTPLGAAPTLSLGSPTTTSLAKVYWDTEERVDLFHPPGGPVQSFIPTSDPNGQLCFFPDGSGRSVTAYNPTQASQHLPWSLPAPYNNPPMNPPVGEAVWDLNGQFTGQTIYVPGPYTNPGSTIGGDVPPDTSGGGDFNSNGTFTGCVFDSQGNLFAVDLGTAQGVFPPPDDGRLIEWFAATNYTTYCILAGPTAGGDSGTGHHVDGTGGLRQPGLMARDDSDNILVPEVAVNGSAPNGHILKFLRSSLPTNATQCPGPSNMPATPVTPQVFIQGTPNNQPFIVGIARDRSTNPATWAVSSVIGSPAIAWYNDDGTAFTGKGPVPANQPTGQADQGYSPFGLAFTPNGDLYFVDIHIVCSNPNPTDPTSCLGPANHGGHVFKLTFTNGAPSLPPVAIASGIDYPVSVTVPEPKALWEQVAAVIGLFGIVRWRLRRGRATSLPADR